MNLVDVFILFGSGYVCGLAILSGFVFSALLQIYVNGKAVWRVLLWNVCFFANTAMATLIPIFLVGFVVMEGQPDRLDFWPRAIWFGMGVVFGASFAIISAHLISTYLREKLPKVS